MRLFTSLLPKVFTVTNSCLQTANKKIESSHIANRHETRRFLSSSRYRNNDANAAEKSRIAHFHNNPVIDYINLNTMLLKPN